MEKKTKPYCLLLPLQGYDSFDAPLPYHSVNHEVECDFEEIRLSSHTHRAKRRKYMIEIEYQYKELKLKSCR